MCCLHGEHCAVTKRTEAPTHAAPLTADLARSVKDGGQGHAVREPVHTRWGCTEAGRRFALPQAKGSGGSGRKAVTAWVPDFLLGDEKLWSQVVLIAAQLCRYTKTHRVVLCKRANYNS